MYLPAPTSRSVAEEVSADATGRRWGPQHRVSLRLRGEISSCDDTGGCALMTTARYFETTPGKYLCGPSTVLSIRMPEIDGDPGTVSLRSEESIHEW